MRLWDTPVPIPNTTVKTWAADGTMLETAWESRWMPDLYGGVAQLGEHLPCKQGVKSSNLSVSIVDVIKQLQSTLYLENFIQMIWWINILFLRISNNQDIRETKPSCEQQQSSLSY